MSAAEEGQVTYASASHPGRVHELNEDSVGCDPERGVWLVADGMGGHACGEVASKIACEQILAHVAAGENLEFATAAAHQAIVSAANEIEHQNGMGSTSIAIHVDDRHVETVWVGDSRAYLVRQGHIRPISKDHSFMQMMIDRQQLTPEQARTHPKRNVLTQVLGFGEPAPEKTRTPLMTDDVLVLCSDGLYDELEDAEILSIIEHGETMQMVADELVNAACERGGKDNISAVVVRYDGKSADLLPKPKSQPVAEPDDGVAWVPIIVGALAAVGVFLIILYFLGDTA